MAGDWIKIEHVTPDKPEIFAIAESLKIDPDAVLGKLVRVWIWADQQTYSGNAGTVTRALLDRVSGISGFAEAMISARWLVSRRGRLVFPNFERHNGQTAKGRALTSKRVARHKAKTGNAPSVTSALPEKRREEKSSSGRVESSRHDQKDGFWEGVRADANRAGVRTGIRPNKAANRSLMLKAVALVHEGKMPEDWFWDSVAAVNAAKRKNPAAYLTVCLKNKAKERGVDLNALLASVEVPASLLERNSGKVPE